MTIRYKSDTFDLTTTNITTILTCPSDGTIIAKMSELIKIPAEAKEIIKHKRTGKVYATKTDFDNDVADPNTDTTVDDFRQDLEIKVTKVSMGAKTKE
jgi:hypothetical protein